MKEMDNNAKAFLVYNDETERIDNEMVDGWLNTLDTLLIFVNRFLHICEMIIYSNELRLVSSLPLLLPSSLKQHKHYNRISPRSRRLSSRNLYSSSARLL